MEVINIINSYLRPFNSRICKSFDEWSYIELDIILSGCIIFIEKSITNTRFIKVILYNQYNITNIYRLIECIDLHDPNSDIEKFLKEINAVIRELLYIFYKNIDELSTSNCSFYKLKILVALNKLSKCVVNEKIFDWIKNV